MLSVIACEAWKVFPTAATSLLLLLLIFSFYLIEELDKLEHEDKLKT